MLKLRCSNFCVAHDYTQAPMYRSSEVRTEALKYAQKL